MLELMNVRFTMSEEDSWEEDLSHSPLSLEQTQQVSWIHCGKIGAHCRILQYGKRV
jgi:hypothetical protein